MGRVPGVSHVSTLSDPRLKVTRTQAAGPEREMYVLTGVSSGPRSLKVNNPDISTLRAALLERMYYCQVDGVFVSPPEVSCEVITNTMKEFRNSLLRQVGRATPVSPEMFSQMYKGRKRTIYEQAVAEYYISGVKEDHALSVAFVKCEKVPSNKAPRCIQPRKPVYNVGVGRFLKPIEHRIYGAIGRVFKDEVVVVKGFNVQEVAHILVDKWRSFSDPVAVGLDATKFDMHVCEGMLEWEHSVYLSIFGGNRTLARYLGWQRDNKGVGYCQDGRLKYKVKGRRFSGDMNTALGNCLIMCAMVWTFAREKGVHIKLANNGDDCVVFMERGDLQKFLPNLNTWFIQLGFRMTVEKPVYNIEEVEFCQMRPVQLRHSWTMVRDIPKAREKDSISIIPLDNVKVARKWIYAVGECGLALCSGVPIMQDMYEMYMRAGVQSRMGDSVAMQSGMRRLARGLEARSSDITPEARDSVYAAWDITPDEQEAIERHYRELMIDLSTSRVDDNLNLFYSPNL